MTSISVPIIARNIVKLKYPLDRVVESVVDFADEVVVSVDPTSEDDTLDYVYDLMYEINRIRDTFTEVRIIENRWNLDNINNGSEFAIQTNRAIDECRGDWLFVLQADEAIHERDHAYIREVIAESDERDIDAFSMIRLYFFGDINTVRRDWTVPITRLFRRGTRKSSGDAMNTEGSGKVADCDAYIYHYSRIGDPSAISKRIRTLDGFFHPSSVLIPEDELTSYAFEAFNFDCMAVDPKVVGKERVNDTSILVGFYDTHPKPFVNYKGDY